MTYHPRPDCRHWPDARLSARARAVLASRPPGKQKHHRQAELLRLLTEIYHRTATRLQTLTTPTP